MEINQDDGVVVVKIKKIFQKAALVLLLHSCKKRAMKLYTDIGYYSYLAQTNNDYTGMIEQNMAQCNEVMAQIRKIKEQLKWERKDYFQDK